jgi:XTP/dITP diphosphohydrolase
MRDIILASSNSGKVLEMRDLLKDQHFNLRSMADFTIPDADETGLTFVENALIKARHACQLSGLPAISDDSGLVVHALQGKPGVFSARYAGPDASDADRIQKVLEELDQTGSADRLAEFHCVSVFMSYPDEPAPIIAHGVWPGEILKAPRGNKGFGYDPIFYVPEFAQSAAEMDRFEKNRISHRGRAMQKLKAYLKGVPA